MRNKIMIFINSFLLAGAILSFVLNKGAYLIACIIGYVILCFIRYFVLKLRYKPYGFDYKYEYTTYKKIGYKNKVQYLSKSRLRYKLYKLFMYIINFKEFRYKNFDTHCEWRRYVESNLDTKGLLCNNNYENFLGFLKYEKDYKNTVQKNIGVIVIPIYMALLTVAVTLFSTINGEVGSENRILGFWIVFGVIILAIFIFLLAKSHNISREYNFYKDYIKIIKNEKKKMQDK